jgi:hypothetical protein
VTLASVKPSTGATPYGKAAIVCDSNIAPVKPSAMPIPTNFAACPKVNCITEPRVALGRSKSKDVRRSRLASSISRTTGPWAPAISGSSGIPLESGRSFTVTIQVRLRLFQRDTGFHASDHTQGICSAHPLQPRRGRRHQPESIRADGF